MNTIANQLMLDSSENNVSSAETWLEMAEEGIRRSDLSLSMFACLNALRCLDWAAEDMVQAGEFRRKGFSA